MFTRTHPLRRYSDVHQLLLASSLEPLIVEHDISFPRRCSGTFYSPELLPVAAAGVRVQDSDLTASKRGVRSRADGKRSPHITPRRRFLFLCCRRVHVCVRACMCVCLSVRARRAQRRWKPPAPSAHALQVRPELRAPRCAALRQDASLGNHDQKCV